MKVAVFGTGDVGRTIASRLKGLGNEVVIGTRDVQKTVESDKETPYGSPPFKVWYKDNDNILLQTFGEAASDADMIFNCTSGQASVEALKLAGDANLANQIIVDIANPLDFSNGMPPSLNPVNTDSLGETIQRAFPESKVVKTLNTMNTYLMVDPTLVQGDHSVFVGGNDDAAKEKVVEVLKSFGWQEASIIDLGDITSARATEMLLPVWLRLWQTLGTADFNFHIQK